MTIEFVFALIGGILIALTVANVALILTLKSNISMGDSKGDFSTFSKHPIRMITKS